MLYGKGAISAIAGERTVSCPTVKDIDAALQQIVGLKLDGLPKFGRPGLPTHKFNIGYNGIGNGQLLELTIISRSFPANRLLI